MRFARGAAAASARDDLAVGMVAGGGRRRSSSTTLRSRSLLRSVPAALLLFVVLCVGAPAAWAGISFSPSIDIPITGAAVVVGQTNVPSQLAIQNTSTLGNAGQTVTLSNITVVPACRVQAFVGSDCPPGQADPGVLSIDSPAFGRAGTACAGQTFTVTNISPGVQDKYLFSPVGGPVVLGPANDTGGPDTCVIDFTVDVLKSPTVDAVPAKPGTQTGNIVSADGVTSGGDPGQASQTNNTTIANPLIQVVKTAAPLTRIVPGGTFTFSVVVTNPSTIDPIRITSLTDNIYGNLATRGGVNTCAALIGTTLAPGASSPTCSFEGTFTSATPASQTDIVTVIGTDASGLTATDNDDATVTLLPLPEIQVVKTASPLSRVEPGGTFTFTLVVSNPSAVDPITITSLNDNIYGNLATRPGVNTCAALIGTTLAPGASSAPC
ncbi:MAG: hypothetical protein QOG42_2111, partial [Solirubrobacteraceae bacterium]|nr:hypothetical protein [Solirubrobacteraceae bacterium]